jgi:hypothetical protein
MNICKHQIFILLVVEWIYRSSSVFNFDEMLKIWCISNNCNIVTYILYINTECNSIVKSKLLVYICLMMAFHKPKHVARDHWNQ